MYNKWSQNGISLITETKLLGEIKPSCVGQYVRMKVENFKCYISQTSIEVYFSRHY